MTKLALSIAQARNRVRWWVPIGLMVALLASAGPAGAESPCGSESVVPESLPTLRNDCEILWRFYSSLDDPGVLDDSDNPHSWSPLKPFVEWQGVDTGGGRVRSLFLSGTGLVGPLSSALGELSGLENLYLGNNRLTGPIPARLGELASLRVIELGGNRLSGPIPPELGRLTSLEALFLHDNRLTGSIPEQLGMATALRVLELSGNELDGSIPPELGELANLRGLFLHSNRLTGTIPGELGSPAHLEQLFLYDNRLSGSIPPELGLLHNLVNLDLSQNRLVGRVPTELGSLTKLLVMRLDGNGLYLTDPDGALPPEPAGSGSGPAPGEPGPPPSGGRFSDVDGSTHEAVIEIVAALGITAGCNPPAGDRFCPEQTITRAQMMAFLARALGDARDPTGATGGFSDVPEGAWYSGYLDAMSERGVVEPFEDGTFRPRNPVTRLDMAVFLTRAFPTVPVVAEPQGVFVDVPPDAEHAAAIEGILEAGVTRGCSTEPLSYCPDSPVTRAQMASFLVRALDLQPELRMPGDGVRVTMARADRASGYFQAELYRALLGELGYEVSDPADFEAGPSIVYPAMAAGRVDFWVNGRYPHHDRFLARQLPDGSAVRDHVSPVGDQMRDGGLQGFLISRRFAEEHGIATLDDLDRSPAAAAAYDATDANPGNGRVDVYGCPPSRPCYDIIESMVAFSDWRNIDQVTSGYDAMHTAVVEHLLRDEPVVTYAWTPSRYAATLLPGHHMVWLGVDRVLDDSNPLGHPGGETWDQRPGTGQVPPRRCPDAADRGVCRIGWQVADIRVTARNEFLDANPAAARLLEIVKLDQGDVSYRIAAQSRGAEVTDLVAQWIDKNRSLADIWLAQARIAAPYRGAQDS